jgi:hypothetical protein
MRQQHQVSQWAWHQEHDMNIFEGLQYKDLEGMLKPEIHVDEFASKMGDDDDIIVVSFFVRDQQAAKDLMNWFEKGYDFIVDSDKSPGEIKPGRFLVYIEIRRRSTGGAHVAQLLDDLATLTEFDPEDWTMVYEGEKVPFSQEAFEKIVPLTPKEYRQRHDGDLNEMRVAAGLPTKAIYEQDEVIQALQIAAGMR